MEYKIYTDGYFDMQDNIGASAVVVLGENDKVLYERAAARRVVPEDGKQQYSQEQELGACIRAVMCVPDGSRITIFSDSQYCVKVLGGEWEAHANLGMIDRYFEEVRKRHQRVEFRKVRGHSGDKWNERADEVCEIAANSLRGGGSAVWQSGTMPK